MYARFVGYRSDLARREENLRQIVGGDHIRPKEGKMAELKTFKELLAFVSKPDHTRSTFVILRTEDSEVPRIERTSKYGTDRSGYKMEWDLYSPGTKVNQEYSSEQSGYGHSTDIFAGEPEVGFMVLRQAYDGGFSRNYPPRTWTFEVILYGPEADVWEKQLMAALDANRRLTRLQAVVAYESNEPPTTADCRYCREGVPHSPSVCAAGEGHDWRW
jgi:hypothetical protein